MIHLLYIPQQLDVLRERLDADVTITTGGDSVPEGTQILVAGRPQPDHLRDSIHTLIIPFAGLPASTRELLADYPQVAVYNLHHNAPMTAEMAFALLLASAKKLIPVDRRFREHDWTPRYEPVVSLILEGKTALIVGYGAVGQRVGAMCRAFGMNVIATRRTVRTDDDPQTVYPASHLLDLLPRAHALIVCTPGTPETEGMIGEREIRALPPGAVLVNVGRGAVVDQHALYAALKDGHLHAAGLDVWYTYPQDVDSRSHTPPADVPFHELDNVVMSPHRAGGGGAEEVEYRRMVALAETLNPLLRGDPAPHRVDPSRGY